MTRQRRAADRRREAVTSAPARVNWAALVRARRTSSMAARNAQPPASGQAGRLWNNVVILVAGQRPRVALERGAHLLAALAGAFGAENEWEETAGLLDARPDLLHLAGRI